MYSIAFEKKKLSQSIKSIKYKIISEYLKLKLLLVYHKLKKSIIHDNTLVYSDVNFLGLKLNFKIRQSV